jgi:hypothetical protein
VRLPRFRFSVWRMMVAVAVLASILGGVRLYQIRLDHLRAADSFAKELEHANPFQTGDEEVVYSHSTLAFKIGPDWQVVGWAPLDHPPQFNVPFYGPWNAGVEGLPNDQQDYIRDRLRRDRELIAYNTAMRDKHTRAANMPWLWVSPDPPPPFEWP